ncbi:2-hydroxyglutaryl-CoA dehydratase [Desulfosarcina ovata subsp. sediminis]|uniref:2-hydroxyglutaryl-CoA dehydratase n=1 Tax=Desulfosarcina ovata subsp. sediminis TaxID=885957 RepID=A0A5K7ZPE1_9BACT|nr:acyl-CoA dehydratase activase [Desulfosarcina ovata]BBO82437.1 2-hydroxyglutaryl-CoA dehydratase [Desulfosarcina ovata subsp. sediminis]
MSQTYFAGIDAGSTYVKAALMDENQALVAFDQRPTGIDADGTSQKMIAAMAEANGIPADHIQNIIATGYSRRNISMARDTVTEIKAHARGAAWSAPNSIGIRTVIDIGGQDSKVIVLDGDNEILNFAMNDKCAAGTGRFLESLARVLELDISELGPLSLQSNMPLSINSTCVVFAESEVVSLVARKKKREDIAAGIHHSLAKRIAAMARKAGAQPGILLTGGGGRNAGIASALDEALLMDIHVPEYPQLNGALGAALIGMTED